MLTGCLGSEEPSIKVSSKKDTKEKSSGIIKLKKPVPKQNKPGNWKEGTLVEPAGLCPEASFQPGVAGPVFADNLLVLSR